MPNIKATCQITSKTFEISEQDQAFYERIKVPHPKICHEERLRRRLMFRNTRTLYKRKCDKTGKSIISMYHKDAPFPVWHRDEWWADGWKQPEQEIDFSRPFFEQLEELRNKCARPSVFNKRAFSSDYCNISDGLRDCYLSFVAFESRDLLYSHRIFTSTDLVDCYYCTDCQKCYNCVYCFNSFNLVNCIECKNSSDSAFLFDCIGCKNCFMCTNLRQKEYYIFNQPHTKEEYEAKMKKLNLGSHKVMQYAIEKFKTFRPKNTIYRSNKIDQSEQATGHRLFNCKGADNCFEIEEARDVARCIESVMIKDCMDCVSFGGIQKICELGYELQESCDFYNFKFCNFCYSKTDLEYSEDCQNCSHCFGCIGLKNEEYCILNKKYPEKEYHELKEKLIQHMHQTGEYGWFFPPNYSPFAYNESEAQEYFPLTKEEALAKGYRWKDDLPTTEGIVADQYNLPDRIQSIDKDICTKVLECEVTKKKFKITEQELKFYKDINVALPRRHPDQRHADRIKERKVTYLYDRQCDECQKDIESAYPKDQAGKVLCDDCYFKEVY